MALEYEEHRRSPRLKLPLLAGVLIFRVLTRVARGIEARTRCTHGLHGVPHVLLDCQFQTDHLRQFGVVEMPKAEYLKKLAAAIDLKTDFYDLPRTASGQMVMSLL